MSIVKDVHKMDLHDTCIVSKEYISAIRVPGGWIYKINSKGHSEHTFVPYSEEFNKQQAITENEADKTRPLEVLELLYLLRKYTPEEITPEDCAINVRPTDTMIDLVLTWGFEYEQHEYFHNVMINEKQLNNRYAIPILEKAKYDMQRLIK